MATGRAFSQGWKTPCCNESAAKENGTMKKNSKSLAFDDSGATAIEYALIATLVAVVLITSLNLLSTDLSRMFNNIANTVTAAI
jgi:pilus assembly protein Flp/PilA